MITIAPAASIPARGAATPADTGSASTELAESGIAVSATLLMLSAALILGGALALSIHRRSAH